MRAFQTLPAIDPRFVEVQALARAEGVRCLAYRCRVTQRRAEIAAPLPILG